MSSKEGERIPFYIIFQYLLARNEQAYGTGSKIYTDEELLTYLINKYPEYKVIQNLIANKTSIAILRGQFNRGELHKMSIQGPPDFMSFRYNKMGARCAPRAETVAIDNARQKRMIATWKESREKWEKKRELNMRKNMEEIEETIWNFSEGVVTMTDAPDVDLQDIEET